MPQLHVDIVTDSNDFWARMAREGARAGQVGEQLGKSLGQGITKGAGGGTSGTGANMATNLGIGNNFVFAIQDASSAIGQFGVNVTGLRFLILGAANNIQMMAMTASLAGVGFRGLLASILPVHIGLAAFSAAISLLPLLFSRAKSAAKELTDELKAQNAVAERRSHFMLAQFLQPRLAFPQKVDLQQNLQEAIDAEIKAKTKLTQAQATQRGAIEKHDEAKRFFEESGGEGLDFGMALRRARQAEERATAAATVAQSDHTRALQERLKIEQALIEKEAPDKLREMDTEIELKSLRIKKLRMPESTRSEFFSPDEFINRIQTSQTSGEDKLISLAEKELIVLQETREISKLLVQREELRDLMKQ